MNYEKLINERKSTRDFKSETVKDNKLEMLLNFFNQSKKLFPEIKIETILFRDGHLVYDKLEGVAGYNGRMIKAPHYIVIASEEKDGHIENTGFAGENMILKAVDEGIDTCWVTFEDGNTIKNALGLETDKEITGLIAVGYGMYKKKILHSVETGGNYSKADMRVIEDNTSFRYAVEEIVFLKEWGNPTDYKALEQRGLAEAFAYVRLAPSTLNAQPWKLILDDSILVLTIKDRKNISLNEERIDAGIFMLHFYLIAGETLYEPFWQLGKPDKTYNIPNDYRIVGWCKL